MSGTDYSSELRRQKWLNLMVHRLIPHSEKYQRINNDREKQRKDNFSKVGM